MALTALFVALIAAIIAAANLYFLYLLNLRLSTLVNLVPGLNMDKYAAPPLNLPMFAPKDVPDMDVTGAWAMEQEQAGIRVSEDEIAQYRLMRAEAGL